ncbi:MAG: APC family permease [Acidobacteriaceae bacterium]
METEKLRKALGIRDVFLFYIVSGLSLRWIATASTLGPAAIVIWILAFLGFFLPLAVSVLDLSSRYPQEGGLYVWTREAYGEFAGFMAAWSYWMSNLPYFASVLYFAASSLLFVGPHSRHLENANTYFLLFTTAVLVLITVLNVVGLEVGKWINNLGAVGMAVPLLVLIALGAISFFRFGSATHFTLAGAIPRVQVRDLVFWSTIFFAFSGCECASFMGDEIKDARRVVPPALLLAGIVITLGYLAGTVSMLVALPANRISGLGGFMTTIDFLCRHLGLAVLIAPVALLVGVSNVGAAAAYLSSTARLPFVVGIDHYLPAVFGRIHPRWRTPYIALIVYGSAGILFGVLSQAGTSVQSAYQLLVAMSFITYFIPYLLVFASMIRLQSRPYPEGAFRLPGGKRVAIPLACVGFFTTALAIVLAAFPAEDERYPGTALFKIVAMTLVVLIAGVAVYLRGQRSISRAAALSGETAQ